MCSAGYEAALGEMLVTGNNHAHVISRRLVWLRAVEPLLQVRISHSIGTSVLHHSIYNEISTLGMPHKQ